MYCAYVTRIHNLRKHTNADRLLCGECFGNTVIVDLGTDPDQLGVYFPTDGKLGLEFAQKNDLLRRKDENGAPAGGYLDPEKRNIKALKLRGEKSDGFGFFYRYQEAPRGRHDLCVERHHYLREVRTRRQTLLR